MKTYSFAIASALLLFSISSYAALPICAKNCDEHWNACIKTCASGEDGRQCKNTCADQHESCLNACSSGASIGVERPDRLFSLNSIGRDSFFTRNDSRIIN